MILIFHVNYLAFCSFRPIRNPLILITSLISVLSVFFSRAERIKLIIADTSVFTRTTEFQNRGFWPVFWTMHASFRLHTIKCQVARLQQHKSIFPAIAFGLTLQARINNLTERFIVEGLLFATGPSYSTMLIFLITEIGAIEAVTRV